MWQRNPNINSKCIYVCVKLLRIETNYLIQTYSVIPSSSLKSKLSSLRSKKPLLWVKTSRRGLLVLWMMFVSCMESWSPQSVWRPSTTHWSSCRGLNPQQLGSKRLWIWNQSLCEKSKKILFNYRVSFNSPFFWGRFELLIKSDFILSICLLNSLILASNHQPFTPACHCIPK